MLTFNKIKCLILIMTICLLGGCGVVNQSTGENVLSPNKLTDSDTKNNLNDVIVLIKEKKYPKAIEILSKIKNNAQADSLLKQLRYIISGNYIANLNVGVAAIDNNGKVNIVVDNSIYESYHYKDSTDWIDITSLSFAQDRLDALDKNGLIHSTRDNDSTYDYVVEQLKTYKDLTNISTDYDNYVLLSKTGNLSTYTNKYGEALKSYQNTISTWKDVVNVKTGPLRIVALKNDGTVYVADFNKYLDSSNDTLYDDMANWTNIVDISASKSGPVAGLKSDGTVVISTDKNNKNFSYDVSGWTDIIAISKSATTLLGLKSDGTVIATGDNKNGQLDISSWSDIVAISAGDQISIGLKADGTLVIAGKVENGLETPDVSEIKNLYVPIVKY